jgi:hypothetical protein
MSRSKSTPALNLKQLDASNLRRYNTMQTYHYMSKQATFDIHTNYVENKKTVRQTTQQVTSVKSLQSKQNTGFNLNKRDVVTSNLSVNSINETHRSLHKSCNDHRVIFNNSTNSLVRFDRMHKADINPNTNPFESNKALMQEIQQLKRHMLAIERENSLLKFKLKQQYTQFTYTDRHMIQHLNVATAEDDGDV